MKNNFLIGNLFMEENNINYSEKLENKVRSLGIDITLVGSLVNFLVEGINDNSGQMKNIDIANLSEVIKRMVRIIKIKQDNIEKILNI